MRLEGGQMGEEGFLLVLEVVVAADESTPPPHDRGLPAVVVASCNS